MSVTSTPASPLRPALLAALALAALLPAAPLRGQEAGGAPAADRDAALAVVTAFFDGMRAHDSTAIRATLHPEIRLLTTGEKDGQPFVRAEAMDDFLAAVAGSAHGLDERLRDPEVRVDEGLASVWAGYDFYLDGAFSHCGVDAFQLARTSGGWKIVQIMDTRRKEGCAAAEG
ncbi:MAG TPA: nuclear transport factor 2 family protein [Gemmatimonadota bacterium]|nr:nuclear transport factor 2 family protein [Gemmatimonadota bacterium]